MGVHPIKQGDRTPPLEATLKDDETGLPLDLTETNAVRFSMRHAGTTNTKVSLAPCGVSTPPTDGKVTYTWGVTDTDTPDLFEGEFEVEWADGKKQTVPSEGYVLIRVFPQVA